MRLLQLTVLADIIGWRNEWAWDYTDLSYCSDSSGRICFSFLLYHFFFYYPTLYSDDRAVMENRWKLLLGVCVNKLCAWWWLTDVQAHQTAAREYLSESSTIPSEGDKTIQWHYYFLLWFLTSCSEMPIPSSFSFPRSPSSATRAIWTRMSMERELLLHSSQLWRKIIVDMVLAFPAGVGGQCCRCFCCLGWLKHCCGIKVCISY